MEGGSRDSSERRGRVEKLARVLLSETKPVCPHYSLLSHSSSLRLTCSAFVCQQNEYLQK